MGVGYQCGYMQSVCYMCLDDYKVGYQLIKVDVKIKFGYFMTYFFVFSDYFVYLFYL